MADSEQIIACRSHEIAHIFLNLFDFKVVHGGAICASDSHQCICKSLSVVLDQADIT